MMKKLLTLFLPLLTMMIVNGEMTPLTTTPSMSAVIRVCSEEVLLPIEKIRHVVGRDGILVRNLNNFLELPGEWLSNREGVNFSLRVDDPSCRSSSFSLLPNNGNYSATVHFYPNGYFRHEMEIYAPDEYCVESIISQPNAHAPPGPSTLSSIKIKLCTPNCGPGRARPCIKKCCPLDLIYRGGPGRPFCVRPPEGSSGFSPPIYHDYNRRLDSAADGSEVGDVSNLPHDDQQPSPHHSLLPHFVINFPGKFSKKCVKESDGLVMLPASEIGARMLTLRTNASEAFHGSPFRIRYDGAIMYKTLENKCNIMKSPGHICVDGMRGGMAEEVNSPFGNGEDEYILFHCHIPEKDSSMDAFASLMFGPLLLVTSVFPLVTCVVYVLLWKRQTVHGWTIAATSGCLSLMYIFHGVAHVVGLTAKGVALDTWPCRVLGILIHFFMLSTFTWLTVMSCDLWLTFRSVTPINPRLYGVSRYLKYSLFGWGVPGIVVLIGILMDFAIYSSEDCSYHAVPGYGHESCWIVESSLGEYLYYPAGLLLCVNIVLFTGTCVKLCEYGRGPRMRTRRNDATGECFSRFTKLFCVMGISWIFEVVSWYVSGLGFVWYWFVIDVFNILRAVGVFVIYVCKKDIILQLEDVHPSMRNCLRPFGRLFLRKCSEEVTTDATLCTGGGGGVVSGSPGIPLKGTGGGKGGGGEGNESRTMDIPK